MEKLAINRKPDSVRNQTQVLKIEKCPKGSLIYKETEDELVSMILKITMRIKSEYSELSKFLEEMNETIPDEKRTEVTLKDLKTYYDSLNSMLNKYILEQSLFDRVGTI